MPNEPNEIRGARTRLKLTQKYMADNLGMAVSTYRKKENGRIRFSDKEKIMVARLLGLTPVQMNEYFRR